uniref:Uncharacterized protein LOC111103180 n=1 Tax=Crassostrea virginica TaxID=6565 RepID=A0A8B8AK85_CRAVI|nr:uncharacterized protein LOC111103180 [Crassostrea virginica]
MIRLYQWVFVLTLFLQVSSMMFVQSALFLSLVNVLSVIAKVPTDLDCPEDGSEITIDEIGMTSQFFRFPSFGENAFPLNFECNWKLRAQSGLRVLLQVRHISMGADDVIRIYDHGKSNQHHQIV